MGIFLNAKWKPGYFCQLQSINSVSALACSAYETIMKAKRKILENQNSELFKQLHINDAIAEAVLIARTK